MNVLNELLVNTQWSICLLLFGIGCIITLFLFLNISFQSPTTFIDLLGIFYSLASLINFLKP